MEKLLKLIEGDIPVAFPVTNVLFRISLLGKVFMFAIPAAYYVHEKQLDRKHRYAWAIRDTFDMLSPQFDAPMRHAEAKKILQSSGFEQINALPMLGVNIFVEKTAKS